MKDLVCNYPSSRIDTKCVCVFFLKQIMKIVVSVSSIHSEK